MSSLTDNGKLVCPNKGFSSAKGNPFKERISADLLLYLARGGKGTAVKIMSLGIMTVFAVVWTALNENYESKLRSVNDRLGNHSRKSYRNILSYRNNLFFWIMKHDNNFPADLIIDQTFTHIFCVGCSVPWARISKISEITALAVASFPAPLP